MVERDIPQRLWDYGLKYEAEILSRIPRGQYSRPGLEILTGNSVDISEWIDFQFYDLVWYHDQPKPDTSEEPRKLGRWLGMAHRVGSDLCYWILTASGKVLARTTVQHVTALETSDGDIRMHVDTFNKIVKERLDDTAVTDNDTPGLGFLKDVELINEESRRLGQAPSDLEYGDMLVEDKPEADDHPEYDKYIGLQLSLDWGGEPVHGTVKKQVRNLEGQPVGRAHRNPVFDTREYDVEMMDGTVERYSANVIAENLYAQVDDEGRMEAMLKEIGGHRKGPNAVDKEEGFIWSHNGNQIPIRTTKGWEIEVHWKDGSISWVPLKDVKDSNPIELMEYAIAQQIDTEPAFNWWIPSVRRQRRRIIQKVQKKYWKVTHKYGVKLPHSTEEALEIDHITGTTFWSDAIEKELKRVKVAWEERSDLHIEEIRAGNQLIGYTEISCHMIFDVKMDFTRKAHFMAGGHMMEALSSITYASVVTHDSVRLAFLIAAMDGLNILACDIGNAYLNAPCREKIWFLGGAEVGTEQQGKALVITRALYGLKSSGASWRTTLAATLTDMGFQESKADPNVWRREARKGSGDIYYELLLVYGDDILCVSHDPRPILDTIDSFYKIKEGSLEEPSTYLGTQIYKHNLPDGRWAWGMSSHKYVQNAVKTVEGLLKEDGDNLHLKTTAMTPYPATYKPELDTSDELCPKLTSPYRQLIGILRCAVEIGRIDIYLETAVLSQYLANPRIGHLEAAYHIFAYLKSHPKMKLVFDPTRVGLDESSFAEVGIDAWKDFYGDVVEELPPRMPIPRGRSVDITCFVDSNHAGNVVTRRSHTGIIIFVQNAPVIWHSRRQNTVESSTFGSEFVAMRQAKEMIVALRYKLRMFGVPISGPAAIMCDNQGVVKNASIPDSTLTKRHNAINYHVIREAAAAGIIKIGKEDTKSNLADLFTKVLPQERRNQLLSYMTYSSAYDKLNPPARATAGVKQTRSERQNAYGRLDSDQCWPAGTV